MLHQAVRFAAPFLRERLEVHLDLLRDFLPFPLSLVVLGVLTFLILAGQRNGLSAVAFSILSIIGIVRRIFHLFGLRIVPFVVRVGWLIGAASGFKFHVIGLGCFAGIALAHLFQLLSLTALSRRILVSIRRPCRMIVPLEQGNPIVERRAAHPEVLLSGGCENHTLHQRIYFIGKKASRQHLYPVERFNPLGVLRRGESPRAHIERHALGDDIARQIPCLAIPVVLIERVAEDAVHHHMQVVADELVEALLEPRDHARRIERHTACISGQRIPRPRPNRQVFHAPKGHVQETELQHELNATFVEDVPGELVFTRASRKLRVSYRLMLRHVAPPTNRSPSTGCRRIGASLQEGIPSSRHPAHHPRALPRYRYYLW